MQKVFVSSPVHERVLEELEAFASIILGYGTDASAYSAVANEIDAVLLRSGRFTEHMMRASPRLKIIARHGAGYDTVDLEAATARKIWVTNTPGANGRAVAEHVFAMLLSLARKLSVVERHVLAGKWGADRMVLTGTELNGKTIGLIGFGHIGAMVAGIARGFGMNVVVTDPALKSIPDAELVALEELLRRSDVVSLHVPLLPSTRNIINAESLAAMKFGAILINTGRGGLVDENALAAALISGRIAGAGLDVLQAEDFDMNDPLPHSTLDLSKVPNLLVTPHVGGQSEEALLRVGRAAVSEIGSVLDGRLPQFPVNDITSGAPVAAG